MPERSISPFERLGAPSPFADSFLVEHVWTRGDNIFVLAHRYLGDYRLWWEIADRNDIVDVRDIRPGRVLLIPSVRLQTGRYESL
jgi:nucleoid-associated protein YgaU